VTLSGDHYWQDLTPRRPDDVIIGEVFSDEKLNRAYQQQMFDFVKRQLLVK